MKTENACALFGDRIRTNAGDIDQRTAFNLNVERSQRSRTNSEKLFESEFAAASYSRHIGHPPNIARVAHNGLKKDEFVPVRQISNAADVLAVSALFLLVAMMYLLLLSLC